MDLNIIKNLPIVNITSEVMEQEIITFLTETCDEQWDYIKITDDDTLNIVHDLLIEYGVIFEEEEEIIYQNPILCYYYGIHYHREEFPLASKKYYKQAIRNGISEAMDALGYHYYKFKNYGKMEKYYLMAIEHGNKKSMYHLAEQYRSNENYRIMKKYYLMAI